MEATVASMRDIRTRRAAVGRFWHLGSPRVLGGAMAVGSVVRARRGRPRPADLVSVGVVAAFQPFVEWSLHREVLHQRPRTIAGRTVDLSAGHRAHHRDPDDPRTIVLIPTWCAASCALIAVVVGAGAAAGTRLLGGDRRATAATAALAGWSGLAAYEWTHFLIHTAVPPRSRWYANVRTNHRLHHWRNETQWLGVTSNVADRVLGTLPARPGDVARTTTARHPEVDGGLGFMAGWDRRWSIPGGGFMAGWDRRRSIPGGGFSARSAGRAVVAAAMR